MSIELWQMVETLKEHTESQEHQMAQLFAELTQIQQHLEQLEKRVGKR